METTNQYLEKLEFNRVTRALHSFRFKETIRIVAEVARTLDRPVRILELGCAHCRTYGELIRLFEVDYVGIDWNPDFVATAKARYGGRPGFTVREGAVQQNMDSGSMPDVVLALEFLEHLPEGDVDPLLARLAGVPSVRRYVFSVPVEVGPALAVKNLGSAAMGYVRHREYRWSETFWAAAYRLDKLPPHGTDHKGFDWRRLRALLGQHLRLVETRGSPFGWTPTWLAPSILFVCEHR